jgi:DNA-directed RNA polymerase specialized sigma24 family protein
VAVPATSSGGPSAGELRRDRHLFEAALDRWYPATFRLARSIVQNDQTAREITDDAWHGVLTRLGELNPDEDVAMLVLKRTAEAAASRLAVAAEQPAVDPARFEPESSRWAGWWSATPHALMQGGANQRIGDAVSRLQAAAAAVVVLRDVEGLSAGQVQAVLGFAPDVQQTLLHGARITVWQALAGSPNREQS